MSVFFLSNSLVCDVTCALLHVLMHVQAGPKNRTVV